MRTLTVVFDKCGATRDQRELYHRSIDMGFIDIAKKTGRGLAVTAAVLAAVSFTSAPGTAYAQRDGGGRGGGGGQGGGGQQGGVGQQGGFSQRDGGGRGGGWHDGGRGGGGWGGGWHEGGHWRGGGWGGGRPRFHRYSYPYYSPYYGSYYSPH
jgi:hypothetical protein